MGFLTYIFNKRPSITYAITVCNEHKEINDLLSQLVSKIRPKDEIVVLQDVTIRNDEVSQVLNKFSNRIHIKESRLDGDFATFKNQLIPMATKDYLFQIDADEMLPVTLIDKLPGYLELKNKYDCFYVPRINTVEGITDEHIKKWKWEVNADGYINYPDWQARIIRLKTDYPILWFNKVHEVLKGFKREKRIQGKGYEYAIIHKKEIKKQVEQNAFYDSKF